MFEVYFAVTLRSPALTLDISLKTAALVLELLEYLRNESIETEIEISGTARVEVTVTLAAQLTDIDTVLALDGFALSGGPHLSFIPILVALSARQTHLPGRFHGVRVSTLDFESNDPSSNLGGTIFSYLVFFLVSSLPHLGLHLFRGLGGT